MKDEMNAFPRWMAVALAAAFVVLTLGGTWFYQSQSQAVHDGAEAQLSAIGQLKANQIAAWRTERLDDAAVLTGSSLLARSVARFLADPRSANARPLLSQFRALQTQYDDVLLVDKTGRLLLRLTNDAAAHENCTAALATALQERNPVFGDLYIDANFRTPHFNVVAPIFDGEGPAAPPLGAIILIGDASRFLYPLISSWPTPSKTAETLLVRRQGNNILFLNDLRHQPDTALTLRLPLSRTDVPAVMAALGKQGVVEGIDYRGAEVLSVLLPVPDSPWFLVAKQDSEDIFAVWRFRSALILAFFAAIAGGLVAIGLVVWQRNKKAHYRTLYVSETRLRENERKFRLLFENMTVGFALHEMIYDPNGQPMDYRFLEINPAFEKLTGAQAQDLIGRTVKEAMPDTEPYWIETYGQVTRSGEPLFYENYAQEIDRYFEVWAFSAAEHKFAVMFTDITERKRAEQSIAAKNKELEQLIYVASHDLRSPLVNVDGYGRELGYAVAEISGALDASPSKLEAAVRAALPEMTYALHHIRNSSHQMDGLLKGLLKVSRSGRAALNIALLDMNTLVARVVSSFEFQTREAGAKVQVSDLPPCKGDEVQMTQVFINLIGNALKYLDPARPGVIRISGVVEKGHAVYCVEDNGIGIALQHQQIIFELFHRLDPSRTEGEGLGLTIIRQILSRLDGDIRVESAPGEGSRFYVTLPNARLKRGLKK